MAEADLNETIIEAQHKIVKDICKQFVLSDDIYKRIKEMFLGEIKKGLCKYTHESAAVKCFMTFVEKLPNGCERGKSLALDVDETRCRVLYINLQGDRDFRMYSQNYPIPPEILVGPGRDLFDFFVKCIADFVSNHNLQNEDLSLGFNFGFPLNQTSIKKAILTTWTRDISCAGVVGRDVVALLQDAINRRGDLHINNIVIANDTTGTLVSCAWKYREAKIGLVVSTGFNVCYLEKTKYLQLTRSNANSSPTMIINCESGAFGNDGTLDFMRTPIDVTLDKNSIYAGEQIFEKMISGMYLGEVARLTMLECIKAGGMMQGELSEEVRTPMIFDIEDMSQIEGDGPDNYALTRTIFEKMGYSEPTNDDCENLRYICTVVSTRSANLIASCLACLIDRIGDPYLIIGVKGSIYDTYPNYSTRLERKLKRLVRPEYKFDLVQAEGDSGQGAALLAASARKGNRDK
ncbi:hexokinase type 2-like [Glossina fuscipes]|uniref:Phosphotransferase n=1 Tax=Glossina fuscipes TaxID=7396 RepID=A0A9C5Z7N3_9MUSC|nr:hexokinase type 2-like [Glossina fuscipes]KAI9580900.1 hypothetical protein GQX74_013448 [Glossina fuscipes]